MVFYRTRKIGNNFYRYRETRKREGKKVISISECLGRVPDEQKGLRFIERQMEEYPRTKVDQPSNEELKEKASEEEATPVSDGQHSPKGEATEGEA